MLVNVICSVSGTVLIGVGKLNLNLRIRLRAPQPRVPNGKGGIESTLIKGFKGKVLDVPFELLDSGNGR